MYQTALCHGQRKTDPIARASKNPKLWSISIILHFMKLSIWISHNLNSYKFENTTLNENSKTEKHKKITIFAYILTYFELWYSFNTENFIED